MDIKEILKTTATELQYQDAAAFRSVFYGNDFETNIQASDEVPFPLCQIHPPLAGGIDINPKTGSQQMRWNVFVFFCDKRAATELDTTAELNDEVINRMAGLVGIYVNSLFKTGFVDLVTKVDLKPLFFQKDVSCSGVLAMFTVKERRPHIIC